MDRYSEIASQLEAKEFKLELKDCTVKQLSASTPEQYNGTGTVEQDEEGNLHFSMETSSNFEFLCDRIGGSAGLTSGKLIPDSAQFIITGTDEQGGVWESSASLIHSSVDISAEIATIKLAPKWWSLQLEADPNLNEKKWNVAGKLRTFPSGKLGTFTKGDDIGDDAWKVVSNQPTGTHSFTYITDCKEELESRAVHMNMGWSILCGFVLQPYISSIIQNGVETIKIVKVYHGLDRNKLYPFIDPRGGKTFDYYDFIRCWMGTPKRYQEQLKTWEAYTKHKSRKGTLRSPLEDIFQHFSRIQFAFNMNMENAVQVLTAAVEGIIQNHCKSYLDGDKSILELIDQAQPFIDSIKPNLDERVNKLILDAFKNSSVPKMKSLMKRMQEQGIISKNLAEGWTDARHKPAHGELFNASDDEDAQNYYDGFFLSYEIFKRLIFCLIGYRGSHINIEKPGWPSEAWPPQAVKIQ